jgi:hypothetical protein
MLNAYHLHLLKMLAASIFFTALSMSSPAVAEEYWKSVSAGWKISCGVDRGSIVRQSGTTYVFKTSSNKCSSRGTYSQRAELSGLYFSARNKVSYQFSSTVQIETKSREQFTIFQVHDGRGSCAPPLKLHWTRHDTLVFYSAYSLDKGAHDCVENASLVKQRYTGPRLKRDGTAYELKVVMDFDGIGGFHTTVFVNGRKSLSGTYTPPTDKRFFRSDKFWLKHGNYSKNAWPYTLTSTDIKVFRKMSPKSGSTNNSKFDAGQSVGR